MISFRKVTKCFGGTLALGDVSFEIEPEEFVFITGPSGSGKTTILRLILKEIMPDIGEVVIAGRNVAEIEKSELPAYRRSMSMVFQDFRLLSDRTVKENVGLALAIRGVPEAERDGKVKEVLASVGIESKINSFSQQLAGGELQRAVIARAIVGHPKILLADEPTGNLDPDTAWGIVELLETIRKNGTTIIMATHNKEIVDRKKGHVIHLQNGKILRDKKGGKYKED